MSPLKSEGYQDMAQHNLTAQFATIPQSDSQIEHSEKTLFDDSNAEPMIQSMRIFNIFDIDKNGKIDLNELKVICKSIGIHPTMVTFIH